MNLDFMYYLSTDHLGSIDALCNTSGDVVERYSYDAWGNKRNPSNWSLADTRTTWITTRGFTGHEHLDKFGLINANARMYEPLTGKFLAPDPYVQAPEYSQSFNRYAYCWNNPLKYTDPSGEFFFWDSFAIGFIHGFFSTSSNRFSEGWKEAEHRSYMDRRIWNGLFVTDENKSDLGKAWEIVSKFTWQAPQTIVGLLTAHAHNTLGLRGGVESVNYKYGATVLKTRGEWSAVTQGSFIVGDNTIDANPNNPLFQHEYGHYIQSQGMGLAYYSRVGIPSAKSEGEHDFHPVEQDANRRAFMYFNKHVDDFYVTEPESNNGRGWDFFENPMNIEGQDNLNQYVDYKNPTHLATLINNLSVYSKWYDSASWMFFPIGGPIWVGLINSNIYNK